MSEKGSPFVPGARVAVTWGYSGLEHREDFVEKVHKNGNFTLRSNPKQQWRPHPDRGWDATAKTTWRALQTGEQGYHRQRLTIWDETTDAEISAKVAEAKKRERLRIIQGKVERLRADSVTDAVLDAIEAVLK